MKDFTKSVLSLKESMQKLGNHSQICSDLCRIFETSPCKALQKKQIREAKCSQVKQSVTYCNEDVREFKKQLAETLSDPITVSEYNVVRTLMDWGTCFDHSIFSSCFFLPLKEKELCPYYCLSTPV